MSFITQFAMRPITAFFSALAVSASLLLSGCGGGEVAVDGTIVVTSPPVQVAAFDLAMFVNGQQLRDVNLLPGEQQNVQIPVGSNFDLTSSGPVAWTVVVGGSIIDAPVGSTIFYGNAAIVQTLITNARFTASTSPQGFLPNPVVVTLLATSLNDPSQEAQLNVVLTN